MEIAVVGTGHVGLSGGAGLTESFGTTPRLNFTGDVAKR
jgi:hypothetical protein